MARNLMPYDKWNEDDGDVIWWRFPITEPPYFGSPLDLGFSVGAQLFDQFGDVIGTVTGNVGGWPFLDPDAGDLFFERVAVPRDPRERETR